ncbi:MAG: sulfurtransferase [Pseudomonadota bacterium]
MIDSKSLQARLDSNRWVVLDCRFSLAEPDVGFQSYREAHIPGAQFVDLERDASGEITPDTGRHPLPDASEFASLVGQLGVQPDSQVVVYDDSDGAMAARTWFLLRWIGHKNVAVLDGGLQSWMEMGGELSSDVAQPDAQLSYPTPPVHDFVVSSEEVERIIDRDVDALIDARASIRFLGIEEPIDDRAGHIPGAINRPYSMNLNENGKFKSADTLRAEWTELLNNRPAIVMCGSGVTACHHLVAMSLAGIKGARLYAGSWSEWIRDEHRPITERVPLA